MIVGASLKPCVTLPGMRSQSPNLSVLTDRDCLVTFAAMALCCDNSVRDHEMGYYQGGGTLVFPSYAAAASLVTVPWMFFGELS